MADQTTMFSYIRKDNSRKPKICVDSREASNVNGKKIISLLNKLGAEITVTKLDFGDYLIGEDVAIERKTVFDFANTLTQRFLFDQIFKMREAYPNSLLLIEGYMGLLRKFRRITPESLNGALFTLAHSNIPIVPTIDYKDTAVFIITSARQLLKTEKTSLIIRHRLKTDNIHEQQLFVVAGLPNVGPVLGENLLNHFKTVRTVFSTSKEEIMEVKGIGPQRANDIVKVLDTPYECSQVEYEGK